MYGDAWKTPEVIQSYSAVKGKSIDRAATNTTPSLLKNNRYSKGFDLCKLINTFYVLFHVKWIVSLNDFFFIILICLTSMIKQSNKR